MKGCRAARRVRAPPQLAWLPVDQLTVDPAYFNSDHLLCAQRRNFRLVVAEALEDLASVLAEQ
jgi:hypothetical protein